MVSFKLIHIIWQHRALYENQDAEYKGHMVKKLL